MRWLRWITMILALTGSVGIAGDNRWTNCGPPGGGAYALAFHPTNAKQVFVSVGQGLFRSRDSGTSWERLDVNDSILVARIHPDDPTAMLGACKWVYASRDLGETWENLGTPPYAEDDDYVQDMEFHPKKKQVVYIVTWKSGVYKSTDGGKAWVAKNSGIELDHLNAGESQIEVHPTNGDIAYVMLSSLKVYKTTNGGETWRGINSGLETGGGGWSLTIDPKNPSVLYLGGNAVGTVKTTDGGGRWSVVANHCSESIAIDRVDPRVLYASSWMEIYKSTDSGTTWTDLEVKSGETRNVAVNPRKPRSVFVASDRGVLRSLDAGRSWTSQNRGIDGSEIRRLVIDAENPKHILAATFNDLFESQDRGETWALSSLTPQDSYNNMSLDIQMHPKDPSFLMAGISGSLGSVALSTNGGVTWAGKASEYYAATCVAFDPKDRMTLYVAPTRWRPTGAIGLGMAKSTDTGETWNLVNSGITDKEISAIAVDPRNGRRILVGTSRGRLFMSLDGGTSWQKKGAGVNFGDIRGVMVDRADSQKLFVAGAGIFRSTDGADSWRRAYDQGRNFVIGDLRNKGTYYCGGSSVQVTTDDAETWTPFDTAGLGPFTVRAMCLDPSNPDRYFIGTDRGVFSYTRKALPGGPVIVQLSPSSGKPGDAVTISGKGFGQLQSDSKVRFGAVDAGIAQSWSDTSIKVTVPNGVQTGSVTVTVLGKKSNPYEFIVLPVTGNVYPTSGPAKGGTRVTILAPSGTSGTQFNVLFGATVAGNVRFTQPNVITCDSPPGTGTVDVKVTSSVTSTTVGTFTYQ